MNVTTKRRSKTETKSVKFIKPTTTKHKCEDLWNRIEASRYKVFIVEEIKTSQILSQWYKVKVSIYDTNKGNAFQLV